MESPRIDSLESFIQSLTVPPPPENGKTVGDSSNDDLSVYIIPPPPSSSPSTEAQNEVIAKFMAAADEMKKMFESDGSNADSQSSFKELQEFWSEIKNSEKRSSGNFLLHLDALTADSGSHSGDSSGYDTLTSSLTSYSDTVTSDEIDGILNSPCFSNSSDSTPVFEQPPTKPSIPNLSNNNGAIPVPPRLKTSCVDDATSPLSITSPSSTTSSDSSVILLDGVGVDALESSRKTKPTDFNSPKDICQAGSCDNLVWREEQKGLSSEHSNMVRSISWTSIADMDGSNSQVQEKAVKPNGQKPPISPHTFQQVCFLSATLTYKYCHCIFSNPFVTLKHISDV